MELGREALADTRLSSFVFQSLVWVIDEKHDLQGEKNLANGLVKYMMEKPAGNLSDFCRLSPGSGIVCADISLVANKLASQNIKEKLYPKLSAQEQVGLLMNPEVERSFAKDDYEERMESHMVIERDRFTARVSKANLPVTGDCIRCIHRTVDLEQEREVDSQHVTANSKLNITTISKMVETETNFLECCMVHSPIVVGDTVLIGEVEYNMLPSEEGGDKVIMGEEEGDMLLLEEDLMEEPLTWQQPLMIM